MNPVSVLILALFGLTEAEHARGWKNETVTLADGSTRPIIIRRFATGADNERALLDYGIQPDARYLLAQMIEGGCDPVFFDALAIGELDRLGNLALALLLSTEWLTQSIRTQVANLTPADAVAVVSEAKNKLTAEAASQEGGFHG